jgi:type IV pilus assembly protein PilC
MVKEKKVEKKVVEEKKIKVKKERELSAFEEKLNDWVGKITPIPFIQKIFFVDHLRTMIHASLSLVEALGILGKEMENRRFKKIIGEIKKEVEKGRPLSEVLAEYPKVFPPIYVKMVASGEISGKLDESLQQIVVQMKKSQALSSSIRGAMIYPSVIVVAIVGVAIFMMTAVLPKMMTLFTEFDAELPLATKVLITVVGVFNNPIALVLIIMTLGGLIAGFIMLLKRVLPFRHFIHNLNLNLPIIGPVIKQINLARFSLTLSSLLKSTIPIIDAIDITADTCSNLLYQNALHETATEIKGGRPLSELLSQYKKLFPPMVTEMVMVGERSGEVDQLLSELSNFYGEEVDKTMKNFATIIEPIIIIVMGLAVAGIAVAVIMPMYTLVQAV